MKYNEIINKVNKDIKEGKKIHEMAMAIAFDLALNDLEKKEEKKGV